MNKFFGKLVLLLMLIGLAVTSNAQIGVNPINPDGDPILTIKTHRYDTYGSTNVFQMSLMASQKVGTTQIKVDFGYGKKNYTVSYSGEVYIEEEDDFISGGSYISGSVSPEGVIKVYGNAKDIDYLDIHGSEVYDIDVSQLTEMTILELSHNEIEKLDVSHMYKLNYVDVKDNPFDNGFTLGTQHPYLYYICVNQLGDKALPTGTIDLSQFPALRVFSAWDTHALKTLDVSKNKVLQQLSIDNTGISSIDVSNNEYLQILNVSDCGFTSIDISHNPYLVEFYIDNEGQTGLDRKVKSLDFSNNPHLQRIFCQGNALTTLDISKQKNLVSLYAANNMLSYIKGADINEAEHTDSLAYLDISNNEFDFSNLPEVDPMTYYYYDLQHDLIVDKEYCAGKPINLSKRLLRETTTTWATAYTTSRDGFSEVTPLEEGTDFNFNMKTCELTFLHEIKDSVVCAFYNDFFNGVTLYTTCFVVRSEEDFGKPVYKFSATPKNSEFAMIVTTPVDDILYVDFGDGKQKEFATKANELTTISGTVTGAVRVYGKVATRVNTINIDRQPLYAIDLTQLTELRHLNITNSELADIDLTWNNALLDINLSYNKFKKFDLTSDNSAFNKNVLSTINLSNNELEEVNFGLSAATLRNIDASNNKLTDVTFIDLIGAKSLNFSNNMLTEAILMRCEDLTDLNLSHNRFKTIDLKYNTNLRNVDLTYNDFTFSSLPASDAKMVLAPQHLVTIASSAMSVNLQKENEINGTKTVYTWKDADSKAVLTENIDYTLTDGLTKFLEPAMGKNVYCELSNALFPEFNGDNILKTTVMNVSSSLGYEIASFHTNVTGEEAILSLAGTQPDTYIYIDWGMGDVEEYALGTSYRLFRASTHANTDVKIYSTVAENGNLGVLSIDSVTMDRIDVSKLTDLYCLTVKEAGLTEIDLSKNTKLTELNLEGNELTDIDLSNNPELWFLVLSRNRFKTLDLSNKDRLSMLAASYNQLESINTKGLSSLSTLDLAGNKLTTIDLSSMKGLNQLFIAQNQLSEIDLSNQQYLYALDISTNKFDYATLPEPKYNVYFYGEQEPIDVECVNGAVDLKRQATAHGVASNIFFFEGELMLYIDEDGNLQLDNKEFTEGVDFTITEGIVTFAEDHEEVTGLIINELYPDLLLYTNVFSVTKSEGDGIVEVKNNGNSNAKDIMYNLLGQRADKQLHGVTIRNGKKVVNFGK